MPWLAGYMKHGGGLGEEILNIFGQMQERGVSPDVITHTCMLIACRRFGATGKGKSIHIDIARKVLVEIDCIVGNALVDMYSKCVG